MDIRKLAAMALSAVLAAAILVPAPALATQNQPNAQYGSGEEPASDANVTQLTLIAQDPDVNLASNGGSAWVRTNAKVQVPVAINFVAAGTGEITGPSNAVITNFSSYPVNVTNIKASGANGVTFVSSAACDSAGEVYLAFQPKDNTTSIVDLSRYTGNAGAAPPSGEWNIASSSGADGTSLALTGFTGRIGGFGAIDPTAKTTIGQIEWTIKAGTGELPVSLPASLAAASVSDLQAAGDVIRGGHATVKTHYDTLVGQTINTTIGNGSGGTQTVAARLVDVSYDRGLVFMFEQPIVMDRLNPEITNVGGWAACELRSSLNTGSIYTGYLRSMKIGGTSVTPATVTNRSLDYNGGDLRVITTDDTYWLPSVTEIFGGFATMYSDGGVEDCEQFALYKSRGFTPNGSYQLVQGYGRLWLRSVCPVDDLGWMTIDSKEDEQYCDYVLDGMCSYYPHNTARCSVRPCFAL